MVNKPGFFSRIFQLAEPLSPDNEQLIGQVEQVNENAFVDDQLQVPVRKVGEFGSYGTEVNAGYPAEEYLRLHQGRRRADVYDQMRRSDAQIVMCLKAVKNPIKSANWEIIPGALEGEEPTPEAIADADLIRHILFSDLDRTFKKFLSEVLTCLDFGHSVFEITHKVVLDHPKFGSYNGVQALGWRSPRTIERWNLKPNGKLKSVTQQADGDLARSVDIPDDFLLVFTHELEGANYEGISLLRSCYGPWMRKDLYLKLNAIGIEKYAVPSPIGKIPEGKRSDDELNKFKAMLESYTSHQSNYLLYPNGWDVTLNSNNYDPQKVESSIDSEDRRMAKAFLANFLELGMNSGGAYALSNDLSDFLLSGLEHIADEICETINADLITHLVKLNRGPRAVYPRLVQSGISDKAGTELANMLKTLGDGKWLTPEDGDEEMLRRRIGLPARTGEGEREPAAPSENDFTFSELRDRASKGNLTLSERFELSRAAAILKAR